MTGEDPRQEEVDTETIISEGVGTLVEDAAMEGTILAIGVSSMVEVGALMDAIRTPTREIIRTEVEEFNTQNDGFNFVGSLLSEPITGYNPIIFFFSLPIIATRKATFVVNWWYLRILTLTHHLRCAGGVLSLDQE